MDSAHLDVHQVILPVLVHFNPKCSGCQDVPHARQQSRQFSSESPAAQVMNGVQVEAKALGNAPHLLLNIETFDATIEWVQNSEVKAANAMYESCKCIALIILVGPRSYKLRRNSDRKTRPNIECLEVPRTCSAIL